MIRSSKIHFRNFTNHNKLGRFDDFLAEYRRVANFCLDYIWENEIHFNDNIFCVRDDKLEIPRFLNSSLIPIESELSARAIKCCLTQVLGIIRSVTEKRKRALYVKVKCEEKGNPLLKKFAQELEVKLRKPNLSRLKPELNSICADFRVIDGKFNGFLALKCIGKRYGKICLPVKFHRQFLKWKGLKKSFLLSENYAVFRFEIAKGTKLVGEIVGADTGLRNVVTLSNGVQTPQTDIHGHSLQNIVEKVSRKKKGSKAFAKAAEHRRNFIHWSINQLNFGGIRQINLENVVNINFGKRATRKMQAWTNSVTRDKVEARAEEQEVLVVLQNSAYRSQRCSKCGMVLKSNRKKGIYNCRNCDNIMDADLNAAKNHAANLPKLRSVLSEGFFWNPMPEFTVPASKETKDLYSQI